MNKELGNLGELIASQYLENADYQIIQRNYQSPEGEIDIIALERDCYVIVEVKTRITTDKGEPEEAVTARKLMRMQGAANRYFAENLGEENVEMRIDMIAIRMGQNRKVFSITHIMGLDLPNEL